MKLGKEIPKHTNENYFSWLAGFFDGEGCITIDKCAQSHTLRVSIGGNFPEILEEFRQIFGGHVSKRGKSAQWSLSADKALRFLGLIFPYVKVKKLETSIGIKFQRDKKKLHSGTPENVKLAELKWRDSLRKRLSHLNQVRKVGEKVE